MWEGVLRALEAGEITRIEVCERAGISQRTLESRLALARKYRASDEAAIPDIPPTLRLDPVFPTDNTYPLAEAVREFEVTKACNHVHPGHGAPKGHREVCVICFATRAEYLIPPRGEPESEAADDDAVPRRKPDPDGTVFVLPPRGAGAGGISCR